MSTISEATYSSADVYQRLLRIVRPFVGLLCLGIVGNLAYGLVDASFTYLLKPILDKGFIAKDLTFLRQLPFIIVGLFILRGGANFTAQYCMNRAGRHVIYQFRWRAFQHLLKLPEQFFHQHSRGTLLSTIIYNAEQVSSAATEALASMAQAGFMVLGLLTVMLLNSWRLTLIFLLIAPVISVVLKLASRRMRRHSQSIQQSIGKISTITQEALENHQVICIYGGEDYEKNKIQDALLDNFHQELKLIVTRILSSSLVQLAAAFALAVIICLVAMPDSFLQITPGSFVSLISAMLAMLKPIKDLTAITSKVQRGLAGAQSIFKLLDSAVEPETGQCSLTRAKGEIVVSRLSFYYDNPEQAALRDIDFEVQPQQTVAIVGRSGSGKTTLMNLLPRFYELSAGQILLDGTDIRDFKRQDLRRQFAIVSQHVTLFNDTILHNIAYGALDQISRQAVLRAAEQAYALEFIERLPQGLDTVIGDNGVLLSGGQRQRLAIARALFADAPLLILDEATSSLDSEAEHYIQQGLANLMHKRTTFVVAHRLSTIEEADIILVLDQGRLVEQGSHQALLASEGHYAQLHALQFKEDAMHVAVCQ